LEGVFTDVQLGGAPSELLDNLEKKLVPVMSFLQEQESKVKASSEEYQKVLEENERLKQTVTIATSEVEDMAAKINETVEHLPAPLQLTVQASALTEALKGFKNDSKVFSNNELCSKLGNIKYFAAGLQQATKRCAEVDYYARAQQQQQPMFSPPVQVCASGLGGGSSSSQRSQTLRTLMQTTGSRGNGGTNKRVTFEPMNTTSSSAPSAPPTTASRKRVYENTTPSSTPTYNKRGRGDESQGIRTAASAPFSQPPASEPPSTTMGLARREQAAWRKRALLAS
jgi:myosin heavy subunit